MTTQAGMVVTAGYIQSPFQVTFREVELRAPGAHEVLLDVLACGICGYDMEIAASLADSSRPFGHEICGRVRLAGACVSHVKPGDQIVLESGSFCGDCELCRNGRVDLCNKAPGFWSGVSMGFSGAMLAHARSVVPAPDLDPCAAALAEPCGVAIDMVKVADIGMTDRVLVVGTGAIGLMAVAMVRRRTAGVIVAANPSPEKLPIAQRLGADAVVALRETPLAACGQPFGGFDRVLVTAPPQTLPDCLTAAAYGGIVSYIGFDWGPGGTIPLDTTAMHLGKKQLRASFASPAVYLPEALHLLRSGVVPAEEIISHRFPLSRLADALHTVHTDRAAARKVMVIPDALFSA